MEDNFSAVLAELKELHDRKGADYDGNQRQYGNVRGSADWGISPWVGAMLRANDKVRRLQAFAQKGALKNESVEDSLLDLAVYSIIALILWREQGNQPKINKRHFCYAQKKDGTSHCGIGTIELNGKWYCRHHAPRYARS